jgi:hypothetical protein
MKKTVIAVTTGIILASSMLFAGSPEQQQAAQVKATKVYVASTDAESHDYRLERESCCGPQHE